MNIFYLSSWPELAAEWHVDRHVVKMILETGQLLSTAHHYCDAVKAPEGIYKAAYVNHPCAKWVRENSANYQWAYELFYELCQEYTFRYKRQHASERLLPLLKKPPRNIETALSETEPPQAMPDQYKASSSIVAYRTYYKVGKAHLHKWTRREPPPWIT